MKILYEIIVTRIKEAELKILSQHDRIASLEAFNTYKIDQLIKDFQEFKTIVSNKMHVEANFINETKNAIKRMEPIMQHYEKLQDELFKTKQAA
jgi:ribosomal protein S13